MRLYEPETNVSQTARGLVPGSSGLGQPTVGTRSLHIRDAGAGILTGGATELWAEGAHFLSSQAYSACHGSEYGRGVVRRAAAGPSTRMVGDPAAAVSDTGRVGIHRARGRPRGVAASHVPRLR